MLNLLNKFLLSFCICFASFTATYAQNDQLSFGVFPYVSAGKLIRHQSVLHQFLRKQLNRDIEFITAQNFDGYTDRVLNSEYDLIFVPPHLARFCEIRGLYTPLASTQTKIQGIYIAHKDSSIYTLEDLRKQEIVISTVGVGFSLLYQLMIEQMKSLSVKNIKFKEVTAHNNSIFSVYKKDVDVALTGIKLWKNLTPDIKAHLRSIGKTKSAPGFIIMARPSLARTLETLFIHVEEDFKNALMDGRYIFRGLMPYQDDILISMEPYVKAFE